MKIIDVDCADSFTCFVTDYGEMHMAGKGTFEKPTEDDVEIFSTPYPVLLELEIRKVYCGAKHVICLDHEGKCYSLGEGDYGCLGVGDNKNRLKFCAVEALEDYRVIDVSCGFNFTSFLVQSNFLRQHSI